MQKLLVSGSPKALDSEDTQLARWLALYPKGTLVALAQTQQRLRYRRQVVEQPQSWVAGTVNDVHCILLKQLPDDFIRHPIADVDKDLGRGGRGGGGFSDSFGQVVARVNKLPGWSRRSIAIEQTFLVVWLERQILVFFEPPFQQAHKPLSLAVRICEPIG